MSGFHSRGKPIPEQKKLYLESLNNRIDLYLNKLGAQHIITLWLKDLKQPVSKELEDFLSRKYVFFKSENESKEAWAKKKDFIDFFGLFMYALSYSSHKSFNLLASGFTQLMRNDDKQIYEHILKEKLFDKQEGQEKCHSRWFPFMYDFHADAYVFELYSSLKNAIEQHKPKEILQSIRNIHQLSDKWDHTFRSYKGSEFLLHDIEMYLKVYEPQLYTSIHKQLQQSFSKEQLAVFSNQSSTVFEAYRTAKKMDRYLEQQDQKTEPKVYIESRQEPNIHDLIKDVYHNIDEIVDHIDDLLEEDLPHQFPKRSFERVENMGKIIEWLVGQYLVLKEDKNDLKDDLIHQKKRIHELKTDQDQIIQEKIKQAEDDLLINMLKNLRDDYPELTNHKDLQNWCKSFNLYPYPQQYKQYDTFTLSKTEFLNDFEDESKLGYQAHREAELLNYGWKIIGQDKPLIKALINWVD
jgi:hypothetical protein